MSVREAEARPPRSGRLVREDSTTLNMGDFWADQSTPFNTLDAGIRTNLFELKSIYGLSALRDVQTEESSGTVGHNGPQFTLDTTANGPDRALLESAELGRYVPGFVAEPGIYFQTGDTSLSGNQVQRWGYFDADNGLFFGQDSTGLFVEIRSGGSSVKKIQQGDWNLDTLDGTGGDANPSGLNLDISDGHIYRMPFIWYGSGPVVFEVLIGNETAKCHRFTRADGSPLIENPNLPVAAEIDNDGTATAQSAKVTGRQFAIRGDYHPNVRIIPETRTGVSVGTSGFTNLFTVRRKANISDGAFFEAVSVKLAGLDVITDNDIHVVITQDPTLTSASFGSFSNVSDAETALELDTSASVTLGEDISEDVFAGGTGSNTAFASTQPVNFDLIRRKPISVVASAIDTAATVDMTIRFREEW